jgi:tubulin--tyrosine ligase
MELFGLDFMIDDSFHVWLIEVNTNPCLELSSPLLSRILPNMLDNLFRLTLDPLFPPPHFYNPKRFPYDNPLE